MRFPQIVARLTGRFSDHLRAVDGAIHGILIYRDVIRRAYSGR